jgi:hypothetical protein
MASSVTPSNLSTQSMGSMKAYIAKFPGTNTDAGDYWLSTITDIQAIFACQGGAPSSNTTTGASASFTASSGTIWLYTATSNSPLTILVLAGYAY